MSNRSNDNSESRNRYRENDTIGAQERLLRFIPISTYLIKTYITEYWKNDNADSDYVFKEYQICTTFDNFQRTNKNSNLDLIMLAPVLGVNRLVLLNDLTLKSMLNDLYQF